LLRLHKRALIIAFIFCTIFSHAAFADEALYSLDFDCDASQWSGGVCDEGAAYEGDEGIYINNPFGEVKNSKVTHVLEYNEKIMFEAGSIYTVSGYILNPVSDYPPSIRTRASLEKGARNVIINISGAGGDWAPFSTTFYASETGEYNLSLHFSDGDVDFGFFADSIILEKTECVLSSLSISGESKLLIPASGSIRAKFTPLLNTTDGKIVHLLMTQSVYSDITACDGVEYNSEDMILTVFPEASDGNVIRLSCSLLNTTVVSPASIEIALTSNLFSENAFSDNLWSSDSQYEILNDGESDYISLPANNYSNYGFFSTLSYNNPVVLHEGAMYVLRAKIKSDTPERTYSIYAKNTTDNNDGTLQFNIVDISGEEWSEVTAAFIPEASGIYDISVNFFSPYDCTFFIKDIKLSAELSKPEYITIHAPGNIALPDISTDFPVSAFVRDQLGNEIPSEKCAIYIENENEHFQYNAQTGSVSVSPAAPEGEYKIIAVSENNPEMEASFSVTVSHDYIGDGNFENKVANEWWMTSSPFKTEFSIRDNGQKYAHIDCEGNYFILFNNSYIHLVENTAYAFNSSIQTSSDCIVTVFIETVDNNTFPLLQFPLSAGGSLGDMLLPELFISEESSTGRLLIYFQSENGEPFLVNCDNLSLKKAVIKAAYPYISGDLSVNGSGKAEFSLYNNISNSDDKSAGIMCWYVSDSKDGEYTLLSENSRYLYFDTGFANKYVYFEFTPVCPVTGFSGEKIASSPVFVKASDGGYVEEEPVFEEEISHNITAEGLLPKPIISGATNKFTDIQSHWAKDYISALYASGILNGKSEYEFAPDLYITRAEASAMLARAFNIKEDFSNSSFADISEKDWFFGYVNALNRLGIINGTGGKAFSPHENISRQELAAIIMRLYDKSVQKNVLVSDFCFNDSNMISTWAKDFVGKIVSLKIMQGNSFGCFMPLQSATRAETAAVLYRLTEVIK